jgi:hypothetical protein
MDAVVGNLYNELMCLCEVRGELSPEDNARVEARIASLPNPNREAGEGSMSPYRDFVRRERNKEPEISNGGFVAYLILVSMGMALGFMMGYGLLYT